MRSIEAKIHLDRLKQNLEKVLSLLAGRAGVMAVIKCDAYGHGAIQTARVLANNGVDRFAVSHLDEALALRKGGVVQPVLVMSDTDPKGFEAAVSHGITLAMSHISQFGPLERVAKSLGKFARIHVNVDTGMGRFGMEPADVVPAFLQMSKMDHLQVRGIFTHLSATFQTDPEADQYTHGQVRSFRELLDALETKGLLPQVIHAGSSTGLLGFSHLVAGGYFTHVRVGTLLFGYAERPVPGPSPGVLPVAEISTRIISVKDLPAGRWVSYSRTFCTQKPTRMAVLDAGYADGLHRDLANHGQVLIHGKKAPVRGKITLGHTMVDVTDIPGAGAGDRAVLAGKDLPGLETSQNMGRGLWETLLPLLKNSRLSMCKPG